ncbi:FAD synthase [Mycoplasmopsis gallinacea]|uniref:FAD synthase n=1 Tax=Mycoplasmopsis gallinacea TaxID=29556 RepID=A0A6H0V6H9_9BACT|nr:hypothetical protein [Mycoplasmopsis gallinacea]QIW62583.1 hypothetical protein GOQ20_04170 [Mycoplasmopsis gallinacea]
MNDLIIYQFQDFVPQKDDIFILGSFESFHLGHYNLYKKALEQKKDNQRIILVTFNNEIGMPKFNGEIFTDNNYKYKSLSDLKFDAIVELNFQKISQLNGENFIYALTQNLPCTIITGKDFKFGKNASSNCNDISCYNLDSKVEIVDLLKVNGVKISSKLIKELIQYGNIEDSNKLLVFNYGFSAVINQKMELKISENLVRMHPGIYGASLLFDNGVGIYGIIHVKMDRSYHFISFDPKFKIENDTNILIQVFKEFRIISNSQLDNVNEKDFLSIKSFFINLIQNSN